MANLVAGSLSRVRTWCARPGGELALVIALVLVGLVAHGLNMFNSPGFATFPDEGVYAGRAWAVLRELRLAPHSYTYDHVPAGWLLFSSWMWITGGPDLFGGVIESGRMLMLLLHLAMALLVYRLGRMLSRSRPAAALGAFLFSVSPLAIFYQRLLVLENIMLFWTLLSLDLLLDGRGRLRRVVLSGICFGLALLSKETAIALLPALLFIAVEQRRHHPGPYAMTGWLLPLLMVVSWYFLYAMMKGDLYAATRSFVLTVQAGHADLVGQAADALQRPATPGDGVLGVENSFLQLARLHWLPRDAFLLIAGVLATAVNLVRGIRDRRALTAGLLGALPLLYLWRGGMLTQVSILPAVPFLCLNLGMLLQPVLRHLPATAGSLLALLVAFTLVGGYWQVGGLQPLYTARPGTSFRETLAWVKLSVPSESVIIAHDAFWPDLREPGLNGPGFANVYSHARVAVDPEIRDGLLRRDWRAVDYLILSPDVARSLVRTQNTLALDVLQHAHLARRWGAGAELFELWKVDKVGATEQALLTRSASYMSSRFEQGGAYVGPDAMVASESQAYGLLRSVWSDDRSGFDRVWGWTQAHLITEDGLLAGVWRDGAVVGAHTVADANADAALALLLAGRRWENPAYVDAGRRMVSAIWQRQVVSVRGVPYLTAGDWATAAPVLALNPSHASPYAYKIFQEADRDHNWLGVVDSSYRTLVDASAASLGAAASAGVPPEWVGLDRTTGELVVLKLDASDLTRYGYDAPRTYWRIALDLLWTADGRASDYLQSAGFLRDEVARRGAVGAVYAHDGTLADAAPSLVGSAGALAALLTIDPAGAHALYAGQIVGGSNPAPRFADGVGTSVLARAGGAGGSSGTSRTNISGVYWGDAADLYTQEWGWFATAIYAAALPDLWHGAGTSGRTITG